VKTAQGWGKTEYKCNACKSIIDTEGTVVHSPTV
jgi:hypothetical protein